MSINVKQLTTTLGQKESNKKLWQQFCVSTGQQMCDSGGTPRYTDTGAYAGSNAGYGRHYERNRGRSAPGGNDYSVDICGGKLMLTLHPYNELSNELLSCPGLDTVYDEFCAMVEAGPETEASLVALDFVFDPETDKKTAEMIEDLRPESEFKLLRGFITFLEDLGLVSYSDEPENTCNGFGDRVSLEQGLQYTEFVIKTPGSRDRITVSAVMTHNGCDVRGGYTAPRFYIGSVRQAMFTLEDYDPSCLECGSRAYDMRFVTLDEAAADDPEIADCRRALKKSSAQLAAYREAMASKTGAEAKVVKWEAGAEAIFDELARRLSEFARLNGLGVACDDSDCAGLNGMYCADCGGTMSLQ